MQGSQVVVRSERGIARQHFTVGCVASHTSSCCVWHTTWCLLLCSECCWRPSFLHILIHNHMYSFPSCVASVEFDQQVFSACCAHASCQVLLSFCNSSFCNRTRLEFVFLVLALTTGVTHSAQPPSFWHALLLLLLHHNA